MINVSRVLQFLTGFLLSSAACSLLAQSAITGKATEELQLKPDRLRMTVELIARAPTMKEAIQRLSARRIEAEEKLDLLEASKEFQKIDPPQQSRAVAQQQAQLEMWLQQQQRMGNARAGKIKLPKVITVSSRVTAEWELEGATFEELLVSAEELEEKVRSADVGGQKNADPISPEEQELIEEFNDDYGGYGNEPAPPAGAPTFTYVATVSDEVYSKLLAKAFERAHRSAMQIAKAANVETGKLVRIDVDSLSSDEDADSYMPWQVRQRMMVAQGNTTDRDREAVSNHAGPLSYRIMVNVSYDLAE